MTNIIINVEKEKKEDYIIIKLNRNHYKIKLSNYYYSLFY